eukprot:TRINITY_DN13083_c0_g1_i2.p1 TRINITY_DN13083_c0_g1~~TRINITY_DN13083_c0_g1_i2.p1  ORF type:complete len:278 (+),score=55.03 TRINITY_DN13083_c0_g1_i2:45-836(+)
MPFDNVDEQYVRQRKVLVCERCRRQMPNSVQNRDAYQTGGSIGGSLAGSMGGSAIAGAVLGPVGAVAGMIGGAIVGSKAGSAATEGICDAVDATAGKLCPDCKEAGIKQPVGHQNWGGGRLGSSDQEARVQQSKAGEEQSMGARLSEAASRTGEHLSGVGSWLRNSVSSIAGGSGSQDSAQSLVKQGESFKVFSGSGHTLGSSVSSGRSAAAEAALRRQSAGGYAQANAPGTSELSLPQGTQPQLSDEELARQLQAQFDAEGQ